MPNSQASEREGVSAGELPEGLRPADAQCVCDDQLPGGQSRVGENLQATRKNQSHGCPEPRGRTGRDADGTSLGNRRGVATKTGDHQPDRIVSVDGAAGGAERQALAGRQSAAALDGHRTLGGGTALPKDQRLSRTLSAEGAVESVHHSAEGGPSSTGCLMLVARRITVAEPKEPLQSTKTRTSSNRMIGLVKPPLLLDNRAVVVNRFLWRKRWIAPAVINEELAPAIL